MLTGGEDLDREYSSEAHVSTSTKEIIRELRDNGYTDGMIAARLSDFLPGNVPPSINSVRRWRYGTTQPSPPYKAAVQKLYEETSEALSRGRQ